MANKKIAAVTKVKVAPTTKYPANNMASARSIRQQPGPGTGSSKGTVRQQPKPSSGSAPSGVGGTYPASNMAPTPGGPMGQYPQGQVIPVSGAGQLVAETAPKPTTTSPTKANVAKRVARVVRLKNPQV